MGSGALTKTVALRPAVQRLSLSSRASFLSAADWARRSKSSSAVSLSGFLAAADWIRAAAFPRKVYACCEGWSLRCLSGSCGCLV